MSETDTTNPHIEFIDNLSEWIIATPDIGLTDRQARAAALATWEYLDHVQAVAYGSDHGADSRCPLCRRGHEHRALR